MKNKTNKIRFKNIKYLIIMATSLVIGALGSLVYHFCGTEDVYSTSATVGCHVPQTSSALQVLRNSGKSHDVISNTVNKLKNEIDEFAVIDYDKLYNHIDTTITLNTNFDAYGFDIIYSYKKSDFSIDIVNCFAEESVKYCNEKIENVSNSTYLRTKALIFEKSKNGNFLINSAIIVALSLITGAAISVIIHLGHGNKNKAFYTSRVHGNFHISKTNLKNINCFSSILQSPEYQSLELNELYGDLFDQGYFQNVSNILISNPNDESTHFYAFLFAETYKKLGYSVNIYLASNIYNEFLKHDFKSESSDECNHLSTFDFDGLNLISVNFKSDDFIKKESSNVNTLMCSLLDSKAKNQINIICSDSENEHKMYVLLKDVLDLLIFINRNYFYKLSFQDKNDLLEIPALAFNIKLKTIGDKKDE